MSSKSKVLVCAFMIYVIGFYFLFRIPSQVEDIYIYNYAVDVLSYFISVTIFMYRFSKSKYDFYEPYFAISVIYILLFFVTPMYDILHGELSWFGVNDLFYYGIKGTLIALLGYLVFSFFYSCKIIVSKKDQYHSKKEKKLEKKEYNRERMAFFSIILWVFCFACGMGYFLASGKGLSYVLSLGFLSETSDGIEGGSSTVGFLSMFTYSLLPLCFIYLNFGKNFILKLITLYGTMIVQLLRGFRFIVVIMIIALFMIYYLKKKTRPSIKVLILLFMLLIAMIGIVGYFRGATRSGTMNSLDWSNFNLTVVLDTFWGNLRIYKTYYAIIKAVPTMVQYMFGRQMFLYTIIMFIPRFLWPGKPGAPGMEAVSAGLSEYATSAGQAYPCIGEYYYEFGIIGVIIFMALLGSLMRYVKKKYLYSNDILDIITISIWVPSTLQLVIRGYTPSNFYLLLFMLMPIKVLRQLCKQKVTHEK